MINTNNFYTADQNKIIIRIADLFIMGFDLSLGDTDSIDNYQEVDLTDELLDRYNKLVSNTPINDTI